jgi:uncharacterized membrane protein YccC
VKHMSRSDLVAFYQSQPARHAVKTSIAAVLTIIIYQYFNLPNGYWSTISALVVMQSNIDTGSLEMTLRVASERLVGTICGAVVALLVLFLLVLNQEEMIVVIFIIIFAFTYMTKFYKGFNLAGVTALIILLLSNHDSIMHSFAFIRVTEILLGVVVAVVVTIFVWPYRISDHLSSRRLARISKLHELWMQLINRKPHEQKEALVAVLKDIEADLELVKVAKRGIRQKQRELLELEERLVSSFRRLSLSFVKLPKVYWEFPPLQEATIQLMQHLSEVIEKLSQGGSELNVNFMLEKDSERYEKAFDGFRSARRHAGEANFSLDESYQLINTYHALQRCAERIGYFSRLC